MGRAAEFLPDVLADAFRGVKGVQVEVYPDWGTRGRATGFDPFNDDHGGIMNHHTGRGTFDALLRYMAVTSRIAPLCHWSTSRPVNGIVRVAVVAAGRANHAGEGGAGRGGTPWIPTDNGNTYTVGGEHQNDGGQPWPEQQTEVIHIGSAAILTHLGHPATRAVDHKDYAPGRKVDRHSTTITAEQAAIATYMGNPPKPPPAPPTTEDEDMREVIWFTDKLEDIPAKDKLGTHAYLITGREAVHLKNMDELNQQIWFGAKFRGPTKKEDANCGPVFWRPLRVLDGPFENVKPR